MHSRKWRVKRLRQSSGSMLGVVALVGLILLAVCLSGFVLSILFTAHHRTEAQADDLALSMALSLNKHNWVGQMNNIVESTRELVFTSRAAQDQVAQEYPRLKSLSDRLLNEARDSASFVESQRKTLALELCKSAQRQAITFNERRRSQHTFTLPWIRTESMIVRSLEVGTISNIQSSAALPVAVPDLKDYDLLKRFANKESNLYNAADRISLPSPDTDLPFAFSSLPAAVEQSLPSARLVSSEVFQPIATILENEKVVAAHPMRLPSAIRVTTVMRVRATNNEASDPDDVNVTVTALTKGSGIDFP